MAMMYAIPNSIEWHYLHGNIEMSISKDRYYHLMELKDLEFAAFRDEIKLAFRDPVSKKWTKWNTWYDVDQDGLANAMEIHRSLLRNEILVESDYKEYEKNWHATKIIGAILEEKGFKPMYYYSGNKSIHIHMLFDFTCMLGIDMEIQKWFVKKFKYKKMFVKKFIEFLRKKIISCWDMDYVEFDKGMIKSTHLIRSELSRNKKGYKTFLGYTYKDLSFVPYICNEENRIYPKAGNIVFSKPKDIVTLVDEFVNYLDIKKRKSAVKRKEMSLTRFFNKDGDTPKLWPEVDYILSDKFKEIGDGYKRGMFILTNELKKLYSDTEVFVRVMDWNRRMGEPVRKEDVEYRVFKNKEYKLTRKYVQELLESLGIKI